MKSYRLPSGALTKNLIDYADAWSAMGLKLAETLGPEWVYVSSDPGFTLVRKRKLQMGLYGWEGPVAWLSQDGKEAWMEVDRINISISLAQELITRLSN
jgi:hypothetical protein